MCRSDFCVVPESEDDTSVHVCRLHEDVQSHLYFFAYKQLFDEPERAVKLSPEVDLLRGGASLDCVIHLGHFADVFVPAFDLLVQLVHELFVGYFIVEISELYVSAVLCRLVKLRLDRRIYRELDLRDVNVLSGLREVRFEDAEAFDDAIKAATSSLRLIAACVGNLGLVLKVLEQRHE